MPLIHIHLARGCDAAPLRTIADAIHQAVMDAFDAPERDRYQLISQHDADEMILQDTGLGFRGGRGAGCQPRPGPAQKQDLYNRLRDGLQRQCGIAPTDIIAAVIENGDADWSFGLGRAQFLTGELT